MLFATNRTPRESVRTETGRRISFDLQDTTVSQNLFFCERDDPDSYTEIGNEDFFSRLKDPKGPNQVLLYVHGFNNAPEREIFPRAERLESLVNAGRRRELVQVVPLVWPCDDDSLVAIIDDYWDDQQAADRSGCSFARLLGKFDRWRRCDTQQQDPLHEAHQCARPLYGCARAAQRASKLGASLRRGPGTAALPQCVPRRGGRGQPHAGGR